jgi:pimeloyl-ACP methyl ester carboxylesterase
VRKISYIHEYGGSGELVILLHGFLCSKDYWSRFAPKLIAEGYRVISIDLLGFGSAPKPIAATYDYDDHIHYIESVLRELSINEPFMLIGHSMGALLAKRFTLTFPERVTRLILLNPPLFKNSNEACSALRNTGHFYRFLLDSKYRNIVWPLLRCLLAGKMRHTKWSRERTFHNVIESAEAFKDLLKLQHRTLLVVGLRDRQQYINNLDALAPSDSLTILRENVTHHSPVQNPNLLKLAVLNFVLQ